MTAAVCRKCSAPVERGDGPGRPRVYCSVACRRSAEREIRRLDRQIEAAEDRLYWCRINGAHEPALSRHEAERVRLEVRLRELLDDDDVPS